MNKSRDLPKFRLALTMIIAHQRLRDAPIPVNEDLSAFHQQNAPHSRPCDICP
ncbi:hypothetical protein ACLBR5_06040 [Escherichia coli]